MTHREPSAQPHARWLWPVVAACLFVTALSVPFFDLWQGDLRRDVPVFESEHQKRGPRVVGRADQTWVTWAVAENARNLSSDPLRVFDTRQCHPARRALAYGEPVLTLGILSIPGWVATGDPVLSYNLVLMGLMLLSAAAMAWLIVDWTGSPAAAIAAGLIYAYHSVKIADVNHPYVDDNLWTVLALLFARRWLVLGRWRDATALGLCCGLQMGAGLYPLLSAACIGAPFALWAVRCHPLRRAHAAQAVWLAAMLFAFAAFVFGPYLDVQRAGDLGARSMRLFATPDDFFPRGHRFPGILLIALAGVGLVRRPGAAARLAGDVRWPLVAGGALVAAMSISTFSSVEPPVLYGWLEGWLPGLDSIRRPYELATGLHLVLCVLAGLGAAWLLERVPLRFRRTLEVALLAAALVATVKPAVLGLTPPVVYRPLAVAPEPDALAFHARLAELGDEGPLLEAPVYRRVPWWRPSRILLTAYHGRPTSSCYNSYLPPEFGEVGDLARALPDPEALQRLSDMGFATLIVHRVDVPLLQREARRLERAAADPANGLELLHSDGRRSAYAIRPQRETHLSPPVSDRAAGAP